VRHRHSSTGPQRRHRRICSSIFTVTLAHTPWSAWPFRQEKPLFTEPGRYTTTVKML
jgi:hypothetical protein